MRLNTGEVEDTKQHIQTFNDTQEWQDATTEYFLQFGKIKRVWEYHVTSTDWDHLAWLQTILVWWFLASEWLGRPDFIFDPRTALTNPCSLDDYTDSNWLYAGTDMQVENDKVVSEENSERKLQNFV